MSLNISICFILSSDARWFYDILLILFTWQVIETDTGGFIGKILEYLAEPRNGLNNQGLRKGNREALRSWQQGSKAAWGQ